MGGRGWTEAEKKELQELWGAESTLAIAKRFGRTVRAVEHVASKLGLRTRKKVEVGDEFYRLKIKKLWMDKKGRQNALRAECDCQCGGTTTQWVAQLKIGNVKSCGCLLSEKSRERTIKRSTTHGLTQHPLYRVYHSMLNRCYNSDFKGYKNYGGRGIVVCPEWQQSFEVFFKWAIQTGWQRSLTIERKNTSGDYSPANCTIATYKEQANNKTNNLQITAFNETKTISQWVDDPRCKVKWQYIWERVVKLGWNTEQAISIPSRPIDFSHRSQYKGISYIKSTKKWKAYISISKKRIHIGYYQSEEEAARARDQYIIEHGL